MATSKKKPSWFCRFRIDPQLTANDPVCRLRASGGVSPGIWRNLHFHCCKRLTDNNLRRKPGSTKGLAEPPSLGTVGGTLGHRESKFHFDTLILQKVNLTVCSCHAGGQPAQPLAQTAQDLRSVEPAAGEQSILQHALSRLGQHPEEGPVEVNQVGIIGGQETHGAIALDRILPPHLKNRPPQGDGSRLLLTEHSVEGEGEQFSNASMAGTKATEVGEAAAIGQAHAVQKSERQAHGSQR